MSSNSRSGALTAGLILIAIGVIFFVQNLYEPFSAWRLIARYWPVVLILIGLKKLYSYFSWTDIPAAPNSPPKE